MTRPTLADTLEAIAENGVDEFYTGTTAAKLFSDIQARGETRVVCEVKMYDTL